MSFVFFNVKVLFFLLFFPLSFDFHAEGALRHDVPVIDYDRSDYLINLANQYVLNRRSEIPEEINKYLDSRRNNLEPFDLLVLRDEFEPFPEQWYKYSNILKEENKKKALEYFIPYLIQFFCANFGNAEGLASNILPSTTIRDISILEKKSPFDKLKSEIANIFGNCNEGSSKDGSYSLEDLILLFRLLNVSNNKDDIEEVLARNNSFLSDEQTLVEMLSLLRAMKEDDDFLLHFKDSLTFLQQCGLHKGEYECYIFNKFEYKKDETEWNGFLYNNVSKTSIFNFNCYPFFSNKSGYSFMSFFNPFRWIFHFLSKKLNCPGLMAFVDTWNIDFFCFIVLAHLVEILLRNGTSDICMLFQQTFVTLTLVLDIMLASKVRAFIKKRLFDFFIVSSLITALPAFQFLFRFRNTILGILKTIFSEKGVLVLALMVVLYLCLVVYICFLVPMIYFKRLSKILFNTDILRMRRYVRNLRKFYLTMRDKNERIRSLFLKYCPVSSSIFDVDISKNTLLNSEQKSLFNFIYSDEKISDGDLPMFYYLFYKYRDILLRPIIEMQYVGSYVYVAMLVRSGKFCIPQFKYSGENYIRMKDVVHPGIIDRCVKNSFEICEKETGIRNMIFSGSNGTGKTTFQFAVVDNVILAQSLGIACCSEYSATVFDKIISMSNARTDLSEGLSAYTSEVEMVKSCLLYLSENKAKRILLISDEPLSTTVPKFADWIVELIFRRIFSYPNVSSIVATHFKSPREIEEKYKHLNAGNFRFKIIDNGTSIENFHLLERGEGYDIGKTIAEQRGLLDLLDVNE